MSTKNYNSEKENLIKLGVNFANYFANSNKELKLLAESAKKMKYNYKSPTGREVVYSYWLKLNKS